MEGTAHADPEDAVGMMTLQESAMSMYTSCGWFFADISGIETLQILAYAERTLRLLHGMGAASPRAEFLQALGEARSNVAGSGTGADVHLAMVASLGLD